MSNGNGNKLRIASYYDGSSVGRNDGAPLYITVALRRMGHDVVHLTPNESALKQGDFDLHLWIDWGEDALKEILSYKPIKCPKPSVYWVSDAHLGYDYRFGKAKEFDRVYCMQKRAVEEFGKGGVVAEWLPHAVEPLCYKPFSIIKRYDVCFIGHLCNEKRVSFLGEMFKEFPSFFFGQRLFEEAAKKFCQSKIVLNNAAVDDINMRVFEALATQSFLLTENVPTLNDLFEEGTHLITFDDIKDAIDKARYWLDPVRDEQREEIAFSGFELVTRMHTYEERAKVLLRGGNG